MNPVTTPATTSSPAQLELRKVLVEELQPAGAGGSQPTAAYTVKQVRKLKGQIRTVVNFLVSGSKDGKVTIDKTWIKNMETLLGDAIAAKDEAMLMNFARRLKGKLGTPMPTTGALWSDRQVGEVQARMALGNAGAVLADSRLGQGVTNFSLAPQGVKSSKGARIETLPDFAARNEVALKFWGAVSALYAEHLTGDVHVWMPKGITVGSIFWNDELPALWAQKRAGRVQNIYFHTQGDDGQWSGNLEFDEIKIVTAYLADKGGINRGAALGVAGDIDEKDFQLTLQTPISVGLLREGFGAALARARARIRAKKLLAHAETRANE